jgi:hypothetical protein
MADDVLARATESFLTHINEGLEQFKEQTSEVQKRLAIYELWREIEAHSKVPGVATRVKELRERLEHLRSGDVFLRWRPEVYEHDMELLGGLTSADTFRATVAPLDKDSFDDAEFLAFINAQKAAARDRQVTIERVYMFRSKKEMSRRLADPVIEQHLKDLHAHSRYIKLFVAVTPARVETDAVLFGDGRCSISREKVDTQKYAELKVIYTSDPDKLSRCKKQWAVLMEGAKPIGDVLKDETDRL